MKVLVHVIALIVTLAALNNRDGQKANRNSEAMLYWPGSKVKLRVIKTGRELEAVEMNVETDRR